MGAQENVVNNNEDRLPPEAKRMLQSLASNWEDVIDSNALQMIRLKGAMTNEVYQIKWPTRSGELSRKVLVRIYGEGVDVFFNREDEIRTFECMSKHGQGPRLLGRFPNGRIEEFIRARTLSAADLRDPEISGLIAAKLREFNGLDMPGSKKVILWDRLRNWLGAAKTMCPLEEVVAFSLNKLDEEISMLEKELGGDHQRLGFSHNDLQYGNIMIEEVSRSITIIFSTQTIDMYTGNPLLFHPGMKRKIQKYQDYEYAGYAPVAYDIANHFCEMAADYHTETPHVMDYNKYPGLEERKKFVYTYMSSSGGPPSELEVEQLLKDVEKYTLVSHLLWGLWGIISEHVNEIDFNYKEYASQRFQQYWTKKQAVFGSSAAPSHNTAKNRV